MYVDALDLDDGPFGILITRAETSRGPLCILTSCRGGPQCAILTTNTEGPLGTDVAPRSLRLRVSLARDAN